MLVCVCVDAWHSASVCVCVDAWHNACPERDLMGGLLVERVASRE